MKLFSRYTHFLIVLSCVFVLFPLFSQAAIVDVSTGDSLNTVSLTSNPPYPKANEEITLSAESFSTNLNSSRIIWNVNGTVVADDIGKKQITIETGPVGSVTIVTLEITPQGEKTFQKQFTITVAEVAFLWEAKTYTPPFYKGKALFTPESPVVVAAIPQFASSNNLIPAQNLVYQWKQDDKVLYNQSGYGKRSIEIQGNYWGRKDPVSVSVTSLDKSISLTKTITLEPKKPLVLAYEDNPLLGILFNNAITGPFSIKKDSEVSVFIAPYFFISKLLSGDGTKYDWSMNGNSITDQQGGNTVTFRDGGNGEGESQIKVTVSQKNAVYQNGLTQFSIIFK